ncbi:MAG TPA: YoaK family protein [Acidisoma sp.]|jgi:uncharacterized membrane protein YoaK (UPF0700 family)|uniref:YoaK family protein n=1 Tax=Acidisoma sp. TaxID=1872115 RepID=UPI002B77700D|nr:YoaK family protein [Acidisoma sp.]HTH99677.1 YoaK family protein [Acidisoma sp.]
MAGAPRPDEEELVERHGRGLRLGLACCAGFADTFGYIRLHGLLTAHVTGNLAFMAAGIARGNPHILLKFLALPIFILWVGITALVIGRVGRGARGGLLCGLVFEILLLGLVGLATMLLPSQTNPDSLPEIVIGTLLLAAMGAQNAVMRFSLPKLPSTTAMTTNVSEATVRWVSARINPDRRLSAEERTALARGARRIAATVCAFGLGGVTGGLVALHLGGVGLLIPMALLALLILWILAAGRRAKAQGPNLANNRNS